MPNSFFQFKQFTVHHNRCAMKVTTDSCLFGAWVSAVLKKEKPPRQHMLDIGTGTGLLALMIAQQNECRIDAIEIEAAAAAQAVENVSASPWPGQIEVIHSDVKCWKATTAYDCIVSNPPFYETSLQSANQSRNIAHHNAGLSIHDLFLIASNHLTAEGKFFLLLPANREKEIDRFINENNFFTQQKIYVRQTVNHPPFRLMLKLSRQVSSTVMALEEIVIKDAQNQYTPTFVALLKPYYLYL